MPITPSLEQWLINAGYEYHCFISWPHTRNPDMTNCARMIGGAIEEFLALDIPTPKVFLDESEITGGAVWQSRLERALCKSVAMVSICAPIYYHPSHRWCGLEWAAMDRLSQERLPDVDFKAIIPVLLRKEDPLPREVQEVQYIDFSRVIIRGRRYYRTQDFRRKTVEIVNRIEQVARTLADNQRIADCEDFDLPTTPAFADYHARTQPFPFRG
jgi:hypothetical protein